MTKENIKNEIVLLVNQKVQILVKRIQEAETNNEQYKILEDFINKYRKKNIFIHKFEKQNDKYKLKDEWFSIQKLKEISREFHFLLEFNEDEELYLFVSFQKFKLMLSRELNIIGISLSQVLINKYNDKLAQGRYNHEYGVYKDIVTTEYDIVKKYGSFEKNPIYKLLLKDLKSSYWWVLDLVNNKKYNTSKKINFFDTYNKRKFTDAFIKLSRYGCIDTTYNHKKECVQYTITNFGKRMLEKRNIILNKK